MRRYLQCIIASLVVSAQGVLVAPAYSNSAFVERAFNCDAEAEACLQTSVGTLWLKSDLKQVLKKQFDYSLNRVRVRYWHAGDRSAWILEEVGKEQPITFGIVVDDHRLSEIEVLTYRESRGGEVQYPFFRKQFYGASIAHKRNAYKLNQNIDGITGATLSVRAMKKVAKVALFLHDTVMTRHSQNSDS